MTSLHFQKKTITIADNYNDLNGRQLCDVACLLHSKEDKLAGSVKALKFISDASKVKFALLSPEAIDRFLPYTKWVFDGNTLTEQLLPVYGGYCGPKKELENLLLKEFHACEMYYRMMKDGVYMAMEKLVAVLYRRAKENYDRKLDRDGDIREPYNSNVTDFHANVILKWPTKVKHAIVLFYDGCREHLIRQFPDVFAPGDTNSNEWFMGMFTVIRGIADDGKYGKFDEVENLNIYTALLELTLLLKEAKEMENKTVKN